MHAETVSGNRSKTWLHLHATFSPNNKKVAVTLVVDGTTHLSQNLLHFCICILISSVLVSSHRIYTVCHCLNAIS